MSSNAREDILAAARRTAQARGYGGLNFRELAKDIGIKHASIYYYFPTKADLGAAVAQRYREDTAAALEAIAEECADPLEALRRYPGTFRTALETGNRICLCSFMAAEYDELPEPVRAEIRAFADINVAWLSRMLSASGRVDAEPVDRRAQAIFAAVGGAQLVARSRADVSLFDALIDGYRAAGLIPA
jgi:TetR/AcrR family transcriptional repressor of nem operon